MRPPPFELHGWWAPAPTQRWAPVVERSTDADTGEEDAPAKLRRPPAKEVGKPPPFAAAFADVLPASHREALRDAAITYLDECFSAIADGEPGQSYADTPIGSYLPSRYEQYYDGRFARDWTTTVAVVGWKLAQPGEVTLACVAEELALFALMGTVSPSRSSSGPTRRAARLLDPLVQLRSLCLLESGHLDVPGPIGGSEWRWRVEICTTEEDDVHRNVIGGQLDDPAKFW